MNRFLKKLLVAALTVTLILSGTLTAFGADSEGIKVQYNGENIAYSGTARIVDGRVVVPFREILESMGADVTYDSATKTIQVKTADREISFTAGGTDITITKNGVKTTEKMDVAPFIDKGQGITFVPVRFIAKSMGYCVGWDADEKTVVIIDPSSLVSDADTDFSIISKLMKSDLDLEKAYAMTGRFDMDVTTYAEPGSVMPGMDFSVTGSMSGVQQKADADFVMNLAFQFDKMLSKLTAEEKAQMQPLLSMFKDTTMKIKMDGDTGVTYMNSGIFSAIDPTVGANTWYKMNVYDTYEDMGIDMKSITGMSYSGIKLSEMLTASLAAMDYADTDTYQDIKITYSFIKNLIGDTAFTKKTEGSYTTYTLSLNQTSVLAAMTKTALSEGIPKDAMELKELGDLLNESSFGGTVMIKEKGGSLYEYDLKGNCALEDINCSFDMKGNQKNAEGNITIDQKDFIKMVVDVESHITETSVKPDLSLPKDAVVVDYPVMY